jgi:hypothetical protein
MNQYRTACGGAINISEQTQYHLIAHPDVLQHLHAAIGEIHLPAFRKKIEEEIDLERLIGRSGVVKTAPIEIGKPTLFALRANRKLPSRVAKVGVLGEETSKIVVIARPSLIEG